MVEDVQVILTRMVPGKITTHPIEHQLAKVLRVMLPQTDGAMQCGFQAVPVVIVEGVAIALVIRFGRVVGIKDRIGEAASISDDGNGAVF